MEYHNCNKTPLERIDDKLIRELRELENEAVCENNSYKKAFKGNCNMNSCNNCNRISNNKCERVTEKSCGCGNCEGFTSPVLDSTPLAMLYSPYQSFDSIYEIEEGFKNGTIFKCLDFPFLMNSCRNYAYSASDCNYCKKTGGIL